MNKSLILTFLSSSEGGFDVRSQCAWREQKHGNVIGIFQIVQKFSKKSKIHSKWSLTYKYFKRFFL